MELVNFLRKHCTKEEYIEMMMESDECPKCEECCNNCAECIEKSIEGMTFLGEDTTECLYGIDVEDPVTGEVYQKGIYTVVDNVANECTVTTTYTEKDVERLKKEKERAYKSSSFQGYDMICLMLEEVIKDVAGR